MPHINQRIRHSGVIWIIDAIWPHPYEPGRFDVQILRGCCATHITI